jgi:AraC-like DNA-binding protein
MEVASGRNVWVIPPSFALWIPARTVHTVYMPEVVSMRTLYLRTSVLRLSPDCTVLHVGPLLRELIYAIVRTGKLRIGNRVEGAMRLLLVAELQRASPVPTGILLPQDPRALALANSLLADPGSHLPLKSLCARAGLTVRTLERIFLREVGLDFERWRRQARLMKAIELLVAGSSVKQAAFSVGYRQPSAFVAMFRATYGRTPKAWIADLTRRDEVPK